MSGKSFLILLNWRDLKDRLILVVESEEMGEKFAVLVGKTISSYKQSSVGVSNLRAVLKNYSSEKVLESLDSGTDAENRLLTIGHFLIIKF